MTGPIHLAHIPVGADHPPVFLAEIGTFFNQDMDAARHMVERIAGVRAEAQLPLVMKGEILHDLSLCLDDETQERFVSKSGVVRSERYRDLMARKVVPLSHYQRLIGQIRNFDLPLVLSVYDAAGADFAVSSGAAALKIASANITNIPLVRHVAGLGLPLLIDTGRAGLDEVARAFWTARQAGARDIVLEHSPDGHPSPPANHNLRLLNTYAAAFEVPVGLSDHHVGDEMMFMAIALGASLVEKGVIEEPDSVEQDAAHALALSDLKETLHRLYGGWLALGHGYRDRKVPIRGNVATSQRQGLVARQDLRPGDRIGLDTVRFAWPAKGIAVEHWDLVQDWQVTQPIPAGAPIPWHAVHAAPPSSPQ